MTVRPLRPYQTLAMTAVRAAWTAGHRNVVLMMPTGAGKTDCVSDAVRQHAGASCVIAHRSNLVAQLSLALARCGVRHRLIASAKDCKMIAQMHVAEFGVSYVDPGARCAVASAQTLARRDDLSAWASQVTLWVIDEGHHLVRDGTWSKCIARFNHPACLGLLPTATPKRADGKGLGRHASGFADAMVALVDEPDDTLGVRLVLPGESVTCAPSRLLGGYATHEDAPDPRMGFLTPYRVYGAESHLVEFLGDVAESGDWSTATLKSASQQSHIVGDVVGSYKQHASGKIGITFTTDVDTAGDMAAAYRAGGVPAEVLTGETDPTVRRAIFERLARREILQVVAVDVISEGTDIPAIEVVTFARPTASVAVFLQQLGRGLRIMPGKTVTILIDHVGNFLRHRGGPDTPRTWSLDDAERRRSGPSDAEAMRYCLDPTCAEPYPAYLHACPYCGAEPPAPAGRGSPAQVEGDMVLLDPAVLAQLRGEIPTDVETERARLTETGLPSRFITHNLRAHMGRLEALDALRVAMAAWGGHWHAAGLDDRDLQRRFWREFGVDVVSALSLSRDEAIALTARVDASVTAR